MIIQRLSDYINANAPMSNLPELLNIHHSNPLGLHPVVIPLFLLVLAVAMHVITYRIYYKDKRNLIPLLYTLVGVAVVSTYYYCFSSDLPLFEDIDLHRKEISVGWFCQRNVVGIGWSIVGELMLTYIVYVFMTAVMQLVAHLSDTMGMEEKQWMEWQYVIFVMLLGAAIAGLFDEFAPITGVWVMVAYQTLMLLMIIAKTVVDIVRTHNFWHCLLVAATFFVGIEAVTMLAIECIEGYIYVFLPVVCIFATVSIRYKKKQVK
ncbi:MAG: hypothetical protein IKG81_08185 [Bacteroidales bacterium]|nr:hypothetical protein [Bacteroidales bacterium]